MRRDRLGTYGYDRGTSPTLDALGERGVVFEHAYANGTWTNSAHASLLSGLYPGHHHVLHDGDALAAELPTLPRVLGLFGYRSLLHTQSAGPVSIGGGHGLRDDFGTHLNTQRPEHWTPEPIVSWMARDDDVPFMALVHLREAHFPFGPGQPFTDHVDPRVQGWIDGKPPAARGQSAQPAGGPKVDLNRIMIEQLATDPDLRQNLDDIYDSGVLDADRSIAELLAGMESAGQLEDTVVLVLAGHGEQLGQPRFGHMGSTATEVVHIPLIMAFPEGRYAGLRVTEDVSQVDLMPTLLGLAGAPPPATRHGQDLMPLLRGEPGFQPKPVLTQTLYGNSALELTNLITEGGLRLWRRTLEDGRPGGVNVERRDANGAWSTAAVAPKRR